MPNSTAFILVALIAFLTLLLVVLSSVELTKAVLTRIPLKEDQVIKELARTALGTETDARRFIMDDIHTANPCNAPICFTLTGTTAAANKKRIYLPIKVLRECFALKGTPDMILYLRYLLKHETTHLVLDKRCSYHLPTKRGKFLNWVSEVRADFEGVKDNRVETIEALKRMKRMGVSSDRKKLTREGHTHPSWMRRFRYLDEYSSFCEDLWYQIAKDCKYKLTQDDIVLICQTNKRVQCPEKESV